MAEGRGGRKGGDGWIQSGKVAKWQSGRVAEWQSGRVAEWQSYRSMFLVVWTMLLPCSAFLRCTPPPPRTSLSVVGPV